MENESFSGTLRLVVRFRGCLSVSVHKFCHRSHDIVAGLHTSDDRLEKLLRKKKLGIHYERRHTLDVDFWEGGSTGGCGTFALGSASVRSITAGVTAPSCPLFTAVD